MGKIKSFFVRVGLWIRDHAPTRRRIVQVYAALLTNANIRGFAVGRIYRGATKNLCTPGLNCYSCPGAVAACPLGSLQNSLASSDTATPYYILGILALLGLAFGRFICGFFCPVGLGQELLYKIKTPKVKKSRYTRILSYFKYLLLAVAVIAIPLLYQGIPAFCKYICPAGTFGGSLPLLASGNNSDFFAMLNFLFSWKFVLLVVFIVLSIFIFRFFCRFICPLGAIYGFFCHVALLGVKLDKSKCIDCGKCVQTCKMDIRRVGDHECINCGDCIPVCPTKAISWKGGKIFLEAPSVQVQQPAAATAQPALAALVSSGTTAVQPAPVQTEAPVIDVVLPEKDDAAVQPEYDAAMKKFKKRSFWIQLAACVLAAGVLIFALVYYNFMVPAPITSSGYKLEEEVYTSRLEVYDTAYSGEDFSLSDNPHKPKVALYWNSHRMSDGVVSAVTVLNTAYTELKDKADFAVIHVDEGSSAQTVQTAINDYGWSEYAFPFAQDGASNTYKATGGDGAYPRIVFISPNGYVNSSVTGEITVEEIRQGVYDSTYKTVYKTGDYVPDFVLDRVYQTAVTADEVNFAELRGKVTVLNFWYTTCDPCKEELPHFEEVCREYAGEVEFIVIHSNDSTTDEAVQEFISDNYGDWQMLFAHNSADDVYSMLGGKGAYPMTVIIDARGRISRIRQSKMGKDELTAAIEAAKSAQ